MNLYTYIMMNKKS